MKILSILLAIIFNVNIGHTIANPSIDPDPVQWKFETIKVDDNHYRFTATAIVDKGWYIYSQFMGDDGPVPTTFSFTADQRVQLNEEVKEEGDLIKKYDELFEMEISKYSHKVVFVQDYTSEDSTGALSGTVTFMTCDNLRCLPPKDVAFKVAL